MLKIISSMATRTLLVELVAEWQKASGVEVKLESVGGVDAAKRVQSGEAFDGVVLAADVIDRLAGSGQVVAGSRVDLVRSPVGIAVKAGAARPDVSTESALRSAIESATSVGYSTGPSGVALVKQFEKWGILEAIKPRIVQAPAGTPVGSLVAKGEVAIGFQQLSELLPLQGIDIIGNLPDAVAITTIFSAGTCTVSSQAETVQKLFAFMASGSATPLKKQNGMEAA